MLERVTEDYFSLLPTRRSKHHNSTMSSYGLFACCEIPKIKDLEKWIASTNDISLFLHSLPPVVCSFPTPFHHLVTYVCITDAVRRVSTYTESALHTVAWQSPKKCWNSEHANVLQYQTVGVQRAASLIALDALVPSNWSYEQTGCLNWLNSISSIHLNP